MQRNRCWILFYFLVLVVISSCSSSSDGKPSAGAYAFPSPTPFQLNVQASPSLLPTSDSQKVATFTPNPMAGPDNRSDATPASVLPLGEATPSIAIDPLTGLPPSASNLLQHRPFASTVTNFPPDVRPQAGLTLADVVFEYYEEPFYTRFMAVFYGNTTNMVGPVRSGRYFNEHIVRMYHAFFAFQGADPRELAYFMSGDLRQFLVRQGSGSCPPYFYSKRNIVSYDNLYFDITKWNDCTAQLHLDNSPQNIRSTLFDPTPPASNAGAIRIFTTYSIDDYNYWQYDPVSGRYLRYEETNNTRDNKPANYAPLMDYLNGKQVATDNVVVLFVPHVFMNEDEQDDSIFHINLIDSGSAFVFRNGLAIPGYWMRTDIDQPLLMMNLDGSPIYMKPGQTFFEVIGETSTHRTDGTNWYFEYQTP